MTLRGWNFDRNLPPGADGYCHPDQVTADSGAVTLLLDNCVGARINTRGILEFTRGVASFKVGLPGITGAWAALWTMGDPWPNAGEFDLAETGIPTIAPVQTVHYGAPDDPRATQVAKAGRVYGGVFSLRRDGTNATWFVDGRKVAEHPDPSPSSPHWLCADLLQRTELPVAERARMRLSDVYVRALA